MKSFCLVISFLLFNFGGLNAQNYSVYFDATDDYVQIPSTIYADGVQTFTIEAWIKPNSSSFNANYHGIVGYQPTSGSVNNRNPGIWCIDGKIHYMIVNTAGNTVYGNVTNVIMTVNYWYHVALVYSASTLNLYVNGELVSTTAASSGANIEGNYRIGNIDNYFGGNIDEVRFWSTARTQSQISDYMFRAPKLNETGLVAYYTCDNGSGTTLSNVCTNTSSINGTLTNGPTWTNSTSASFASNSMDFDGTNDFIDGSLESTASNVVTMECWVKLKSSGTQKNFFQIRNDISSTTYNRLILYTNSSNQICFYINSTASTSSTNMVSSSALTTNTWYHVAAVYDNQKAYLYLNGTLVSSNTSTAAFSLDGADYISLGCEASYSSTYTTGFFSSVVLDNVRIWNTAKTSTQLLANRYYSYAPGTSGLIAQYQFNFGRSSNTNTDINTLFDEIGKSPLVLRNFAMSGTTSNLITQDSTISTLYHWLGESSTSISATSNWSERVAPSSGANIEVAASATYMPSLSSFLRLNHLTIQTGAKFALNGQMLVLDEGLWGTGTLTAGGNSALYYRFTANSCSLYVDQTTDRTTNTFKKIHFGTYYGSTLIAANKLYISGTLIGDWGDFNGNGNAVFMSQSSGTGIALISPDATVTGNFTVERYIPAKRAFRLFSSPINSTSSIYTNWQESGSSASGYGTHITGNGSNGTDATNTGAASLFTYNNSTQTWSSVTSTNSNTSNLIAAGTPYRLFVRGDRTIDLTSNSSTATNTIIRTTGTLNTMGITVSMGSGTSSGANVFIGNPFQAPLNMYKLLRNVGSTYNTNISNTYYYVWDPTRNTRGAYVTVDVTTGSNNFSGSAANNYLQPCQAAFVKTNAAGSASLKLSEMAIENVALTSTFKEIQDFSELSVQLYQKDSLLNGASPTDGIKFKFHQSFSSELNQDDADKLMNQDEIFAVQHQGRLYSIERRNYPESIDTLQLISKSYRHSNYTIEFEPFLFEGYKLVLYDKFIKSEFEIANNKKSFYSFSVQANDGSNLEDRFEIRTTQSLSSTANITKQLKIYPNPSHGQLFIENLALPTQMSIIDCMGRKVSFKQEITPTGLKIDFNSNIQTGIYFININGKVYPFELN